MDYAMAYPPGPHPEYMRPVARTVTFSGTNSVHMIPPNPPPPQQQQHPEPQPQAPPPQHEPQPQPEQPAPAPEQGAPPPEQQPRQPKRGKKKPPRRVRFGPEPPPPQQQQQQQQQQEHQEQQQQQQQQQQPEHAQNGNPCSGAPAGHQVQQGHGPPGYLRYTPSPLPRWEATPRRHEYFSGEYRYSYPTPVREGIYRMATDANRLTTIFSEENPNACAIV